MSIEKVIAGQNDAVSTKTTPFFSVPSVTHNWLQANCPHGEE